MKTKVCTERDEAEGIELLPEGHVDTEAEEDTSVEPREVEIAVWVGSEVRWVGSEVRVWVVAWAFSQLNSKGVPGGNKHH